MRDSRQLKVGLRVRDLEKSCALYLRLGFRQIPHTDQPSLRYLTFGHTWLILSDMHAHGYHNAQREQAATSGPIGGGFVLAIPTQNLDDTYDLWRREELPVTLSDSASHPRATNRLSFTRMPSTCFGSTPVPSTWHTPTARNSTNPGPIHHTCVAAGCRGRCLGLCWAKMQVHPLCPATVAPQHVRIR
jgi:lactoylglutathione lyase